MATIEFFNGTETHRVDFSIEMTPIGGKKIAVQFPDGINYPLVPVVNMMKAFIEAAHSKGELPD
ncbi:MAG: hypothetical protein FWE09_08085 [Treponema sp.]|nr:hypothetical protein [Treponema sp.]